MTYHDDRMSRHYVGRLPSFEMRPTAFWRAVADELTLMASNHPAAQHWPVCSFFSRHFRMNHNVSRCDADLKSFGY